MIIVWIVVVNKSSQFLIKLAAKTAIHAKCAWQSVHGKVYHYNDKLWDNLEPIVHFTVERFSPVAADEVTERVDSAGDLDEDELTSLGRLMGLEPLFEDSEEDEPDPRVQEQVGSINDGISNNTKLCDFITLRTQSANILARVSIHSM